jgi:hypothetical protein
MMTDPGPVMIPINNTTGNFLLTDTYGRGCPLPVVHQGRRKDPRVGAGGPEGPWGP